MFPSVSRSCVHQFFRSTPVPRRFPHQKHWHLEHLSNREQQAMSKRNLRAACNQAMSCFSDLLHSCTSRPPHLTNQANELTQPSVNSMVCSSRLTACLMPRCHEVPSTYPRRTIFCCCHLWSSECINDAAKLRFERKGLCMSEVQHLVAHIPFSGFQKQPIATATSQSLGYVLSVDVDSWHTRKHWGVRKRRCPLSSL